MECTDGGFWFVPAGQLQKRFDVRDGRVICLLLQAGQHLAFLSGCKGCATEVRARQLGIAHCLVGDKDKPMAQQQLKQQLGVISARFLLLAEVLNDLALRQQVCLLLSLADAPVHCALSRCGASPPRWPRRREGNGGEDLTGPRRAVVYKCL